MNSAPIYAALKLRFAAPEWALMFEVANGTGSNIRRYADAVAMNLFPSRGLELHGVEIKVSRSDWQRELKNPEKAETIFQYCDRWWIAVPEEMALGCKAELPPTWGLLALKDGKLRQVVAAPRLEPKELTRNFIAAMMRRSAQIDQAVIDQLVSAKLQELRTRDHEEVDRRVKQKTRDMNEKLKKIEDIEKAAGIRLTDWNASAEIGHAIKAIQAAGLGKTWYGLQHLADNLKRHAEGVQREIDFVRGVLPIKEDSAA